MTWRLPAIFTLSACWAWASVEPPPPLDLIVVVGAPGEKTYEGEFTTAAQDWLAAARKGKKNAVLIDGAAGTNQLSTLRETLLAQRGPGETELWLVLLGHGTFDGQTAKFNLHGPDLSAEELAEMAGPIQRQLVLVNASSSSAPFLNKLSGENRVIVTATKSGWEENYSRFGRFIAKTIADPAADLDKDGQTSLLEAFLMASRQIEEFYASERRLATEHALIDDNGDALGTPATFFTGVRAVKRPTEKAGVDGLRAHQLHLIPSADEASLPPEIRNRRNELELELENLRSRQPEMKEEDYLTELERILVAIGRLYHPRSESAPEPAGEKPAE